MHHVCNADSLDWHECEPRWCCSPGTPHSGWWWWKWEAACHHFHRDEGCVVAWCA